MAKLSRKERLKQRHTRIRSKMVGTAERSRLCVYKSLRHLHVQIVDDTAGVTLVSASTVEPVLRDKKAASNVAGAEQVGELIAQRAQEKGIKSVVFDRGGYPYHGVVAALAESARKNGLEF